jgi:hypothetical protein
MYFSKYNAITAATIIMTSSIISSFIVCQFDFICSSVDSPSSLGSVVISISPSGSLISSSGWIYSNSTSKGLLLVVYFGVMKNSRYS